MSKRARNGAVESVRAAAVESGASETEVAAVVRKAEQEAAEAEAAALTRRQALSLAREFLTAVRRTPGTTEKELLTLFEPLGFTEDALRTGLAEPLIEQNLLRRTPDGGLHASL